MNIDIAQDFDHFNAQEKEDWELESKEDFIEQLELNGKVVLYPIDYEEDGYLSFSCGPQTNAEALSDSASIDDTLKELVKETPYESCLDVGVAENAHEIDSASLPQGKTCTDAYEFIKQKLLTFDNVVLHS